MLAGPSGFLGPYLNSDKALDPTDIAPVTGLIGTLRVLGVLLNEAR